MGDAVQTVALARLLGRGVRGVYRDRAHSASASGGLLVANGWLADRPAPPSVPTVFAGVFVGRAAGDQFRWLAGSARPVGARDPATQAVLAARGIRAEMVGCATLTLPRYAGPRRGRLAVDEFAPGAEFLTHAIAADESWDAQWAMAVRYLSLLRTAEVVHTTRLHVALPCLAMGTAVVVRRAAARDAFQPARLSLLDAIGFVYDRPCVLDVAPFAERYLRFLSAAVGRELTPGAFCRPDVAD